jgi:hypothetical protein
VIQRQVKVLGGGHVIHNVRMEQSPHMEPPARSKPSRPFPLRALRRIILVRAMDTLAE